MLSSASAPDENHETRDEDSTPTERGSFARPRRSERSYQESDEEVSGRFGRGRDPARRERRFRRPRRKVCAFCVDKVVSIDYKQYGRLREFISERGKILKSRMTGTCARHQRKLAQAVKRARHMALLSFVSE